MTRILPAVLSEELQRGLVIECVSFRSREGSLPDEKVQRLFLHSASPDWSQRDALRTHLMGLQWRREAEVWTADDILPGDDRVGMLRHEVATADLILCAATARFVSDRECVDLGEAAGERCRSLEALAWKLKLAPCDLDIPQLAALSDMLDGQAVTDYSNADEAFTEVAATVRLAIQQATTAPTGVKRLPSERPARRGATERVFSVPFRSDPYFTGRAHEREELISILRAGPWRVPPIVSITGPGGIGKTALAVETAYLVADTFHLVWWIRSDIETTVLADLVDLTQTLGLPISDGFQVDDILRILFTELGRRPRWLLIFDNASYPMALEPYIPKNGDGAVLLTSRSTLWKANGPTVELDSLARSESADFLLRRSGKSGRAAAQKVARELGDFPLLLKHAAAMVERDPRMSFNSYLSNLKSSGVSSVKSDPVDGTLSVTAEAYRDSVLRLRNQDPLASHLLTIFALLSPDDLPIDLLSKRSEILKLPRGKPETDDRIDGALITLSQMSLLEPRGWRLSMHRAVQLGTTAVADERDQRRSLRNLLGWIDEELVFEREDERTWESTSRLMPHLIELLDHAERLGVRDLIVPRLLIKAGDFFHHIARYRDADDFFGKAEHRVERRSAQEARRLLVDALRSRGVNLRYLEGNDVQQEAIATLERAVELARSEYGSRSMIVGEVYVELGGALRWARRLDEALASRRLGLEILKETCPPGDHRIASAMNDLGNVHITRNEPEEALALFEQAYEIDRRRYRESDPNLSIRLYNLAVAKLSMGRFEDAKRDIDQVLAADLKIYGDDHPEITKDQRVLGEVLCGLDEPEKGLAVLKEALESAVRFFGEDQAITRHVRDTLRRMRNGHGTTDRN